MKLERVLILVLIPVSASSTSKLNDCGGDFKDGGKPDQARLNGQEVNPIKHGQHILIQACINRSIGKSTKDNKRKTQGNGGF